MLTLHQFVARPGTISPSGFCLKLETVLRLGGIPYQVEAITDLAGAPKGKAPYITDGDQVIGDSTLITEHLARHHGLALDDDLAAVDRATAHAVQVMMEERFYHAIVYSRWIEEENWQKLRGMVFADVPDEVANGYRDSAREMLWRHGIGRHTPAEIYAFGRRDADAVSTLLGDRAFLFGAQPHTVDATIYGMLASVLLMPFESPLKQAVSDMPNLVYYVARMTERLYPEMAEAA